jgi:DNA-binding LacI/PurR family transcriptional regulator
VAAALRERILSGEYAVGEWLPAERDLTDELRVHRRVIRAAALLLESEGLLVRRPNCRPVVNIPPNQTVPVPPTEFPATDSADLGEDIVDETEMAAPASRTVALLMWRGGGVFELKGTAQNRILAGIDEVLMRGPENTRYHVKFLDLEKFGTEEENAAREAFLIRYALRRGYAGVVFYPYATESNRTVIRAAGKRVPLLLIDRRLTGVEADYVGIQNRGAEYDATKYLIDRGHRRIAFVTLPQAINTVNDRFLGYLDALEEAFGSERQEWIFAAPHLQVPDWPVFEAAFSLPADRRPTAAVCVNDHVAVRVTDHLDMLGLRVPDDVSVVGFDDLIKKLPNGVGLTTIAQPYEDIGRSAAELILRRTDKPLIELSEVELPCRFIERDSVKSI